MALATTGCAANVVPTHHLVWERLAETPTTQPGDASPDLDP